MSGLSNHFLSVLILLFAPLQLRWFLIELLKGFLKGFLFHVNKIDLLTTVFLHVIVKKTWYDSNATICCFIRRMKISMFMPRGQVRDNNCGKLLSFHVSERYNNATTRLLLESKLILRTITGELSGIQRRRTRFGCHFMHIISSTTLSSTSSSKPFLTVSGIDKQKLENCNSFNGRSNPRTRNISKIFVFTAN